jgi:trans-aconitate methyltransferase
MNLRIESVKKEMVFEWNASEDNRVGTDKTTLHAYNEVYAQVFEKMPCQPTIMEIGVLSGASVINLARTFPGSVIYAVDIDLDNVLYRDASVEPSVIHWIEMDATDSRLMKDISETTQMDLIIDDGSHLAEDIVAAFVLWANRLKPGGQYVIEDLSEPVVRSIYGLLVPLAAKWGITLTVHDLRSVKGRWDDILVVGNKNRMKD